MMKTRRLVVTPLPVLFTVLMALAACGESSSSATAPTSGPSIPASPTSISLTEMKVTMRPTFAPGKYTFTIANVGTIAHELLVFRSDLAPEAYPKDSSGNLDEGGAEITKVSDGDNLGAGASQVRQVDLSQPGKYLFVCNLPGHFAQHMYTEVAVK